MRPALLSAKWFPARLKNHAGAGKDNRPKDGYAQPGS